jgi:predicted amidohydrolase
MAEESAQQKVDRLRDASTVKTTSPFEGKVNPFSWMVEHVSGVRRLDDLRERNDLQPLTVNFVLVSMPDFVEPLEKKLVEVSSLTAGSVAPQGVAQDAYTRLLIRFRPDEAKSHLDIFSASLDAALQLKPHVICFNELALPSQEMEPLDEVRELVWQKSQEHNVLIVAGSAHDWRTRFNTAYLFRPGGPKQGQAIHKIVTAYKVKEFVSVPSPRLVAVVRHAGLAIAVMICLDIADYSSAASVVKVSESVDVVLVLCYTPKFDDMASIAKVTSKALPGIVAMVNADRPDTSARNCVIARFGRQQKANQTQLANGSYLTFFDIPYAEFRQTRIDMTNEDKYRDPEIEYLFGRRHMPSRREN